MSLPKPDIDQELQQECGQELAPEAVVAIYKKPSQLKEIWRRMRKNRAAMIGLTIIAVILFLAVFAEQIKPYSLAVNQNVKIRLQPPSLAHPFGTDGYGRDLFARCIHGARVSLSIGFTSATLSLVLGLFFGSAAGYYGGRADTVIMRSVDVIAAIPSILMALAVVAALGASPLNLILAVSFARTPAVIRVVRTAVLSVGDQEYVEAAKAGGTRDIRIIRKSILPNAMGPILVQATMSVAQNILSAATLSFLGLGINPPTPEWGAIISESKEFMRTAYYLMFFPGLMIILSTLSLNLVGDGLRDALDPRLKS